MRFLPLPAGHLRDGKRTGVGSAGCLSGNWNPTDGHRAFVIFCDFHGLDLDAGSLLWLGRKDREP